MNIVKSQYRHLVKTLCSNPYTYYRYHYVPDNDNLLDLHSALINAILYEKPKSVFEFGYGTGKNLNILSDMDIELNGCDISPECQEIAQKLLPKAKLMCGSENLLNEIPSNSFDITFTCSVLNHIPEIEKAIFELKRITRKTLIICESQKQSKFFYPHDYTAFGFAPISEKFNTDIATYTIYKLSL